MSEPMSKAKARRILADASHAQAVLEAMRTGNWGRANEAADIAERFRREESESDADRKGTPK